MTPKEVIEKNYEWFNTGDIKFFLLIVTINMSKNKSIKNKFYVKERIV